MSTPPKTEKRAQPGGSESDYGNFLSGFDGGRQRYYPAVFPAFVDDEMFNRFDADRIAVDAKRACRFTRRRADAAGKFRKIVGRMKIIQRFLVIAPVYQVIPVRDDIVDRAAAVAERDAAIHASRALDLCFIIFQMELKFLVMLLARLRRFTCFLQALELQKAGYFSHVFPLRGRTVHTGPDSGPCVCTAR